MSEIRTSTGHPYAYFDNALKDNSGLCALVVLCFNSSHADRIDSIRFSDLNIFLLSSMSLIYHAWYTYGFWMEENLYVLDNSGTNEN